MQLPIAQWADSDLICNCNGVTKGAIVKAIQENGFTRREEVASFTRASTSCGTCAQLLEDVVHLYRPKVARAESSSSNQNAGSLVAHGEPRQYPKGLEIARIKREGLDLNFARIRELGVRALSDDDYYRLKTYGVCSQKHPEFFMMRIRIPGGRVTAEQLDCLSMLATRYGRGWGHLTTRQDMELHWVHIKQVEEIWRELEAVGLSSRSSCGHTLRNVMACPHAAISPTSVQDIRPWAKAISDYFVSRSAFLNQAMPNRLNIFFAGCAECAAHAPVNDIGFVAVNQGAIGGRPGALRFHLWVGGSLGSYPVLGFRMKSFLLPEEVLPACQAIFQLYLRYGGGQKGKTRLKFLIAELGRSQFEKLFDEIFATMKELPENRLFPLQLVERPQKRHEAGAPVWNRWGILPQAKLPLGWKKQKQEAYAWCVAEMPLGEIRAKQLKVLSRLARRFPEMEVSFTMDQDVEVHWIRRGEAAQVQRTLAAAGFNIKGIHEGPRLVACPGTEFCVLAVTNSQGAARDIQNRVTPRNRAEAEVLRGLTIHVSGCPNSCAKQQIADIGLAGGMASLGDHRRYSYQLYIGGGVDGAPELGTVVRKGLTEEMIAPVVQALIGMAAESKMPGETFRAWVRRLGPREISKVLEEKLAPHVPRKPERIRMTLELPVAPDMACEI